MAGNEEEAGQKQTAEKAPCVRTTFRKLMETILEVNAPTLLTRDYASVVSRSLAPGTRRMNSR